MKIKIMFSLMLLVLTSSSMFAVGFPVTRAEIPAVTELNPGQEISTAAITSPAAAVGDSLVIAVLLFVFLWPFAAHRWYVGKPVGWNILFILTFGGLGIWALVDLINMLTGKWDLS
jgi:hypothetical protein